MNYDTHKVSCDLQQTTRNDKFFLENTRDILTILLTKIGGEYVWKSFSWDTGQGTRTDTFDTFPEYLKKWSKFTLDDFRKLFADDDEIRDMLDEVSDKSDGNPTGNNQHGTVDNVHSSTEVRPSGNSKDAGLRLVLHRFMPTNTRRQSDNHHMRVIVIRCRLVVIQYELQNPMLYSHRGF